jgi:hypothetical protein
MKDAHDAVNASKKHAAVLQDTLTVSSCRDCHLFPRFLYGDAAAGTMEYASR